MQMAASYGGRHFLGRTVFRVGRRPTFLRDASETYLERSPGLWEPQGHSGQRVMGTTGTLWAEGYWNQRDVARERAQRPHGDAHVAPTIDIPGSLDVTHRQQPETCPVETPTMYKNCLILRQSARTGYGNLRDKEGSGLRNHRDIVGRVLQEQQGLAPQAASTIH